MIRITYCFLTIFLLMAVAACERAAPPEAPASDAPENTRIDLIVIGDTVVTMDANATVIDNGAVAIDDGVILAVGDADEISAAYDAEQAAHSSDGEATAEDATPALDQFKALVAALPVQYTPDVAITGDAAPSAEADLPQV